MHFLDGLEGGNQLSNLLILLIGKSVEFSFFFIIKGLGSFFGVTFSDEGL